MSRWLSIVLLFGALLGLVGQEAAIAGTSSMQTSNETRTSAVMSEDCAESMGLTQQKSQPDQPCQGMTPDCIAKMGCAVPLALIPRLAFSVVTQFQAITPTHMPVAPLVGRDTGPEPEPPAHLG